MNLEAIHFILYTPGNTNEIWVLAHPLYLGNWIWWMIWNLIEIVLAHPLYLGNWIWWMKPNWNCKNRCYKGLLITDFYLQGHSTRSLDRALLAKRRRVTSATQLDLQQKDVNVCFTGTETKFPRHNLTFHGVDNKLNELNEGVKIQEDSRRFFTTSASMQDDVDQMIQGLPRIVQVDMQDSLKSTLQRKSSVQFVSESNIQPTIVEDFENSPLEFALHVNKANTGIFILMTY